MSDELALKTAHKTNKLMDRGKRSKAMNGVKSVKKISKNLQTFLEISPVQTEAPSSHKLQDHAHNRILSG